MKKLIFLLLLITLLRLTSCRTQDVEYVLHSNSGKDTLNNEQFVIDWQTDESGLFSYISFKPEGDNIPYIDKDMCFESDGFLYTDGIRYGFMDFEFNTVTELLSYKPPEFINGIARIHGDGELLFISRDYSILPVYYPGFVIEDSKIYELVDNKVKSYSYTVEGIKGDEYLVPAKLYASENNDEKYKAGYTTLDAATSGKRLTINDFVLTPDFDEARLFHDGFAAVKKEGKWGYIDEGGNIVIDCEYTEVGDFGSGFAGVYKDMLPGKREPFANIKGWGIINESGELVVSWKYPQISRFINGIAIAKLYTHNQSNNQTYIDTEGNDLLNRIPSIYDLDHFPDGIGIIDTGTTVHYVNDKAERIIGPSFIKGKPFYNGLAVVVKQQWDSWHYINTKGETVIKGDYLYAGNFNHGYAYVFDKAEKSGYIINRYMERYLEDLNLNGMSIFNDDGYALAYTKDKSTEDPEDMIYYMIHINELPNR